LSVTDGLYTKQWASMKEKMSMIKREIKPSVRKIKIIIEFCAALYFKGKGNHFYFV
jgi:hypothetical protein